MSIYYIHDLKVKKAKRRRRNMKIAAFTAAFFLSGSLTLHLLQPNDGGISPRLSTPHETTEALSTDLPIPEIRPEWPEDMQSAVGAVGYGVIAANNPQATPVPMASLAKVMAAILIIEEENLQPGESGRTITFSQTDEEFYNKYLLEGGVVSSIKKDQSITVYEALQAMLIESSNNIADSAVIAVFGDLDTYLEKADKKRAELGMDNSRFADVTGFSPQSKGTAAELILLADYAMKNRIFADIVATWQTTILGGLELTSTNHFLDYENNGVVGIKSGLTDEAGGTYMSAARYELTSGETIIVLAVTLGAENHFTAQEEAMPLLSATKDAFNEQSL